MEHFTKAIQYLLLPLLLLAWLVWMAGSAGIPFTRLTISLVLLLLAGLGGWLAYRQRHELRQEVEFHRVANYMRVGQVLKEKS